MAFFGHTPIMSKTLDRMFVRCNEEPRAETDTVAIVVGPHRVRIPRILAETRFPRLGSSIGEQIVVDADPAAIAALRTEQDVAFFRQGVFDVMSTGQMHLATPKPALIALQATLQACQPEDLDEIASELGAHVRQLDRMANMGFAQQHPHPTSYDAGGNGGSIFAFRS